MIPIKPFKQKPSYCGPASLMMVLRYFGIDISENKVGEDSGTTLGKGTTAEGLAKTARKYGLKAQIKDNSSIADLRRYVKQEIPVIVQWFSVTCDHFSVVVDIDRENIYLADPEIGQVRAFRINTFRTMWFGFKYPYLRNREDLLIRRLLVINK